MRPLDPVRRSLLARAAERGRSLQSLSAQLGRNAAYLHQYVHRRSPRRLPEDDRRLLAMALGIDERELGARDPWTPAPVENGPTSPPVRNRLSGPSMCAPPQIPAVSA